MASRDWNARVASRRSWRSILRAASSALRCIAFSLGLLPNRLQHEQQEVALVRSDHAVRGLVTATDAFEAIAGEMEDPTDTARSLR